MAKKPKGLSIKRNNAKFVCSWNAGESGYTAQEFRYAVKKPGSKSYGSWIYSSIKKGTNSISIQWNAGVSIDAIKFEVRGKKNKKWSSWSSKSYDIKPPKAPSVGISFNGDTDDARTTFAWSVPSDVGISEWFYRVGWRTRLVNNYGKQNESWSSVVYNTSPSNSYVQQEASTTVFASGKSYTREFQLVAYGPGGQNPAEGFNKPKTVKYVYARPNVPKDVSSTLTENGTGGYLCEVTWNSNSDAKHPIDSQEIQYLITTPIIIEDDDEEKVLYIPSGQLQWQTAGIFYPAKETSTFYNTVVKDTSKIIKKKKKRIKKTSYKTTTNKVTVAQDPGTSERLIFVIDQILDENTVVFVRAVSKRGTEIFTTGSEIDLCDDGGDIYKLSAPSGVASNFSPIQGNRIAVSATNECSLPESFLIISFKAKDNDAIEDIGIIEASDNGYKVVEIPNDVSSYSIGVRAAVGGIPKPERNEEKGYVTYSFSDQTTTFIESDTKWVEGETIPAPPSNVVLAHNDLGVIHVSFDWDWKEADTAELSWSDYKDAWLSTSEPSYYSISNLYDGNWNIADLELGVTYYVRVRLTKVIGETELVSRWSDTESIFLSSAPATPRLEISPRYINPGGSFTASWTYVSTDNTNQKNARLFLYDSDTSSVTETEIGSVDTSQSLKIDTTEFGWEAGDKKQIVVRVMSESGVESEWSHSVELNIIEPITCSVSYSDSESGGLISTTQDIDVIDGETQEVTEEAITTPRTLRSLPFTLTVTGAGSTGRTSVQIKRFGSFIQPGPDENTFLGYDDEIVFSASYDGEAPLIIEENDQRFTGYLDDGAAYYVFATVTDEYGQTAFTSPDDIIYFVVDWNHDAVMPYADMEYITNADGEVGAKITLREIDSEDIEEGDVLDIYRLSVDKPELILSGGNFTTEYVDPYPTIGEFGGYRVVYRTKYNDFIMADSAPAWWDISPFNEEVAFTPYVPPYSIINFEDEEIHLEYDVNFSNNSDKEFVETKYLGGSIQGDWISSPSRSGSINVNVASDDISTIRSLNRLKSYSGSCRVRLYNGSNFTANINVSENTDGKQYWNADGKLVHILSYSLNVTRIGSSFDDVVTLENWISTEE